MLAKRIQGNPVKKIKLGFFSAGLVRAFNMLLHIVNHQEGDWGWTHLTTGLDWLDHITLFSQNTISEENFIKYTLRNVGLRGSWRISQKQFVKQHPMFVIFKNHMWICSVQLFGLSQDKVRRHLHVNISCFLRSRRFALFMLNTSETFKVGT